MITVNNLAEVTSGGVRCAGINEIIALLSDKMKEIYGNDIDLSSASLDAQYIMAESLVLNSICRALEGLCAQLSPATASGRFLDVLATLSHTERRDAEYSTVKVKITNVTSATVAPPRITCIDRNNNEWVWDNPVDYTGAPTVQFEPQQGLAITLRAMHPGRIEAPLGSITATTVQSYTAEQLEEATPGNDVESDWSLRRRCLVTVNAGANTVTDALRAELADLSGVSDVYVLSNATGSAVAVSADETVPAHNVFVALRYDDTVAESDIGMAIFDNLTPGVIAGYDATGDAEDHKHTVSYKVGESGETEFVTEVQWKKANAVKPQIKLRYAAARPLTDEQKAAVAGTVIAHLNECPIVGTLEGIAVCAAALTAGVKSPITGYGIFTPLTCTFEGNKSSYTLAGEYFNYSMSDVSWSADEMTLG